MKFGWMRISNGINKNPPVGSLGLRKGRTADASTEPGIRLAASHTYHRYIIYMYMYIQTYPSIYLYTHRMNGYGY